MMSYVILKILSFFLVPSNVLIGIGLVGIILTRTHFARAGTRFLIVSVTLLFIIGVFPVGTVLTLPLEARFPPWQPGQSAPTGIIVLGSAINPVISTARGDVALNDAAERIIAIVKLARRYPNARVVFSGGNGNLFVSAPSEAPEVLSRALGEIAPDLIINPAAYTAVDKAEDEYKLALRLHKRQRPKTIQIKGNGSKSPSNVGISFIGQQRTTVDFGLGRFVRF